MSAITHDMTINASASTVYIALTTAQGLRSWFTTQAEGTGQQGTNWKLDFTDQPSFVWEILSTSSQHVSWKCLEGPGNAAGTEAAFSIKPQTDNQCTLTIIHNGWTKDDPKFTRCVEIWRTLMQHLQKSCETGIATPAYQ